MQIRARVSAELGPMDWTGKLPQALGRTGPRTAGSWQQRLAARRLVQRGNQQYKSRRTETRRVGSLRGIACIHLQEMAALTEVYTQMREHFCAISTHEAPKAALANMFETNYSRIWRQIAGHAPGVAQGGDGRRWPCYAGLGISPAAGIRHA